MLNINQICFKTAKHVSGKNPLLNRSLWLWEQNREDPQEKTAAGRGQALLRAMRPAELENFPDTSAGTQYRSLTFSFAKSIYKSGPSVPFPEFNTYYPPGTSNNRSQRDASAGQLKNINNLEAFSGSSLMR